MESPRGPEASARLSELLQIPSVNPPGNEEPAARWIQAIFQKEGIPCEVLLTAPGRALAIARIKGKSPDGALCLANHIDVVPAEPKVWLSPELPFSGKIIDGRIYGRGALDMKGFVVMQMMTMILVHRLNIPLEHDLVFLALPDEEGSGKMGAEWLVKNAPQLLKGIAAMWNEGGAGFAPKAGQTTAPVFGLCHGERGSLWIELTAKGPGGHGSTAPIGNAPARLFEATRRILDEPEVMTITPIAAEMFASMAEASEFPLSFVLPRLGNPLIAALADRSLKGDRFTRAVTRNTRNLTTWEMGRKVNVVPAEGRVGIDIRLLPGVKPEDELKEIKNMISDLEIELRVSSMSEGSISPKDSRLFEVIHSTLNRLVPDAKVAPLLSPGGTDSAAFRAAGHRLLWLDSGDLRRSGARRLSRRERKHEAGRPPRGHAGDF